MGTLVPRSSQDIKLEKRMSTDTDIILNWHLPRCIGDAHSVIHSVIIGINLCLLPYMPQ